ncbi:MAG: hypothetical protein K2F90_04835 [Clostridiales bacterium]|nr:hypothetical protein [Clostridiales bacterium]
MRYSENDVYVIQRGGRKSASRRRGGARRSAGILITVLLLLTAAICLLVVFLPRMGGGGKSVGASTTVSGKTYYFLCTAETEDKTQSLLHAKNAADRGGAGYVYNDGKYRIIAAVYAKEADVKTLVTVNADSFYFSLALNGGNYASGDKSVIDYLTGEWFSVVSTASTELDRGNITESAAEYAVSSACDKLRALAINAKSERLKSAVLSCDYAQPQSQTVLSYIRYVNVQFLISVISALK